jgi:predicted nucleotidyltransferase component of viral defense system
MMSLEEILVEKVVALTKRKKGRDLYDLWFLFSAGVKLNKKLLEKKR